MTDEDQTSPSTVRPTDEQECAGQPPRSDGETPAQVKGLYPCLLGDAWNRLDEVVRRLHANDSPVNAEGVLRVCRGRSWLARLVAACVGLPQPADAVNVRLTITPRASRRGPMEEWRRLFNGKPFVTQQWAGGEEILYEQVGLTQLRLKLEVKDGALHYLPDGAALGFRRLAIPLPKWLAPKIEAHEKAGDTPDTTNILVKVIAPLAGVLIVYDGAMQRVKEMSS